MKSKRLKKVSGMILIMVLTVMIVLIIMLMATLTVVTTAGQRIYTKYEEQQAYYTARSALDVFTGSMLSDAAYYAYDTGGQRQFEYTDDTTGTPTAANAPMKQGLALQLDLYKIKSQNTDGIDLQFAENPVSGDSTFDLGSPEESNFTLDSASGLDYIEYDVELPAFDSSNPYGKLADRDIYDEDGDGSNTDQIARIKVEVLDRKLATDPSYTTDQLNRFFTGASDQTGCPANTADLQAAIAKGSRSKDYMKIKVTATVKMMDTEGVAVVIFETTEKDAPAGDNAITTTGGYTGGSGAQFCAAGGAATMDPGVSTIADGNSVSGNVFTVGSFNWNSGTMYPTQFAEGDNVVAMGDIKFTNDPEIYSDAPGMFFYAGGTFDARKKIGNDKSKDISVVCGTLRSSGGDYTIKGNVFCDTVEISQNGSATGTIYTNNISTSYVNEVKDSDGNLVSLDVGMFNQKVNMWNGGKIQKVEVNTTWVPKPGGQSWEGENVTTVNVLATYDYADYKDKIRVTDYNGNPAGGSITSMGSKVDIYTYTPVEKDGKVYRKINLPDRLASDCPDTFVEIPTAQAFFSEYYKDDAFDMTTGDLKLTGSETEPYSDANKQSWGITGADMLAEYMELESISDGTARTMDSIITSLGDKIHKMSEVTELNLTNGDQYYYFDANYYQNKTWTTTGTNGRAIIIIPDGVDVDLESCKIVTDKIDDHTTDITNGVTKAPKVDIYANGSEIKGRNGTMVTAYFMMPTGKVNWDGGNNREITHKDGKGVTSKANPVGIVGSILCGEFTEINKTGVLYLNKNSGAETPGEPHLSVQASQYVRS
ncbi:MAG: hypothetical protein NC395_00940 [Prevotella sp.]|nr:hypothetical protein [Prevotella sp.]